MMCSTGTGTRSWWTWYLGSRIVASREVRTLLIDPANAELFLAAGGTLGLAGWQPN
jgi:hypothetical protein